MQQTRILLLSICRTMAGYFLNVRCISRPRWRLTRGYDTLRSGSSPATVRRSYEVGVFQVRVCSISGQSAVGSFWSAHQPRPSQPLRLRRRQPHQLHRPTGRVDLLETVLSLAAGYAVTLTCAAAVVTLTGGLGVVATPACGLLGTGVGILYSYAYEAD